MCEAEAPSVMPCAIPLSTSSENRSKGMPRGLMLIYVRYRMGTRAAALSCAPADVATMVAANTDSKLHMRMLPLWLRADPDLTPTQWPPFRLHHNRSCERCACGPPPR